MKLSWKVGIAAAVLFAINAMLYVFRPGDTTFMPWVYDFLPAICALFGVFGLYSAFSAFEEWDAAKKTWLLLLIGTILFCVAETLYGFQELVLKRNMDEIFPTISDVFWTLGYVPFLGGLLIFLNRYLRSGLPIGSPAGLLGGGVGFLGVGIGLIFTLLVPIVQSDELDALSRIVYLFYPVADLLLLAPAIVLMIISARLGASPMSKPWRWISLAILAMTIADIAYSILDWQGLYQTGNFIDLSWNASYLLLGVAGTAQRELIRSI